MTDKKTLTKNDFDLITLSMDILIPFILDKALNKSGKGRVLKLIGTVAAQQALKILIQSKAFDIAIDNVLDKLEEWVRVKEPSRIVASYPSANEAMKIQHSKRWNRTKPEDYKDPEREMYI